MNIYTNRNTKKLFFGGQRKMILKIKVKDTDNIIGLKEDIVYRIEQIADVVSVEVEDER
jgi:hypothetical protein